LYSTLSIGRAPDFESSQVIVTTNRRVHPKEELFRSLEDQIIRQGFVSLNNIQPDVRKMLMNGCDAIHLARVEIRGVNRGGRKGAIKFSSIDLFGKRCIREIYLVSDFDYFNRFMSRRLQMLFIRANPNPDRNLRKAFTHFLHDYGLHWSGCYHLKEPVHERSISEQVSG
jgi:hypothetical protein